MRKIISVIICITIILSLLLNIHVSSYADEIAVELDGQTIDFDVAPEIISGRTMVPLRKIFEELGALVKWDSDTQTVSARKSSKTITLAVGSNELTIDDGKTDDDGNPITETVTLDASAQIVSGRTLVPVRAISESFGLDVDWNSENQTVIISSKNDNDDSWKENTASVNLTDLTHTGSGIEINGKNILITEGGDYTLSGKLDDGSITVSTEDKVKLRLSGADITTSEGPCIYIENADKAYITLTENSENSLIAENSEKGAIYSKDNLEIKGKGALSITSDAGHAIKASDNLKIENGEISIEALNDGIHVNDTFEISGGKLDITAVGDGIDSESIVIISGGELNIATTGEPTEQSTVNTENNNRFNMFDNKTDVEFENSTKGIKAEWMMSISGGTITVNSAHHAIHCTDEIEISGGEFSICSEYGKGISAHGNLTVSGSDTVIDITKSTEGLESKNIFTMNDGKVKIVASDDGINATGGNSGEMMPGGGNHGFDRGNENGNRPFEKDENRKDFGNGKNDGASFDGNRPNDRDFAKPDNMQVPEMPDGATAPPDMPTDDERTAPPDMPEMPSGNFGGFGNSGRNLKDCFIINGGYIEIYAEDDCLDSNGNLIINGGVIKATNPTGTFSGAFAVIDPDGQTTIGEDAVLIFATASGSERSLNLSQNSVIINCESTHGAGDTITLYDSNSNAIYEYTPEGNYKSVLIASKSIKTGNKYTISIGDETFSTEISEKSTILGASTAPSGNFRKN